jgi:hypothetical protein
MPTQSIFFHTTPQVLRVVDKRSNHENPGDAHRYVDLENPEILTSRYYRDLPIVNCFFSVGGRVSQFEVHGSGFTLPGKKRNTTMRVGTNGRSVVVFQPVSHFSN